MPAVLPDLRAILDQTHEVVWLIDQSDRRVLYINATYEKVWGRSLDALLAALDCFQFIASTIHPEDRTRYLETVESGFPSGVDHEYRILRPCGEVRWLRSRSQPYDASDDPAHKLVVGMSEDITSRKRHEEQLEAHRHELEAAYTQLQVAVITDPLTGLKNRRALQLGLERTEADAREHTTPVSIIAADIDHFKSYNDTYGHPAGDSVLVAVSNIILRSLRPTDLAARVGGEEFTLLLPDTDRVGAVAAAERLRRAIAHARWPHRPVTVSLGVATWWPTDNSTSTAELIAQADKALYRSKADGRNRVTHAEEVAGATKPVTVPAD